MAYTKAEKERLIKHVKKHTDDRVKELVAEKDRISRECERKVLRRLNTVSVTLWNIKLKNVLELERQYKPTVKRILKDIRKLQDSFDPDAAHSGQPLKSDGTNASFQEATK